MEFSMLQTRRISFYFMKSMTDEDGFNKITIPQGVYETEALND